MTKSLIITAFITGGTTEWRYPGDTSYRFASNLEAWVEIAKLLEKGKIYALFIADHLTLFDVYKGPNNYRDAVKTGLNVPKADPSHAIITAARETKNISFGVTFSTVSEHPYLFARRLATLDHFTQGRVGWNIVTSYLNSIGTQHLNGEPFPEHDERYNRATEYVDVVSGLLLSTWRDDALIRDIQSGVFIDPDRVLQRIPLLIQAGTSKKGQELAAEFAEFVYVLGGTEELAPKINYIRTIAKEKFGRNPKNIKVIYSARVILGRTHDEAIEKEASYKKSEVPDRNAVNFGGVTGIDLNEYDSEEEIETKNVNGVKTTTEVYFKSAKKPTKNALLNKAPGAGPLVGTSEEVADKLEKLVEELDLDGFNFNSAVLPGSVEDLVELLIPELQRRGLFWEDYAVPGGTFRENVYGVKGQTFLSPDHPLYDTRWTADANKEKFDKIYEQNLERRKQARTSLN
ncbi:hypothetical protein KL930_002398 [Ogataea haglerorum]|nr:hypothetical protein KL923_002636 [Ogataea haglerorum]KAG7778311.1 hypothetical protein KL930_002398 [Ogataea haglerorum]KAG7778997.1 hypothetical protein KL922_001482 [Ogataea haglerorum]